MIGKIKVEDINLEIRTGATRYVEIDIFKFIQDEELHFTEVQVLNGETYEYLDEIEKYGHDISDLTLIAKRWLFDHVEIK